MNTNSSLLIYKDKDHNSHFELVTYLPDVEGLDKQTTYSLNTYSGDVLIEDWDGNFVNGFHYENNEVWQLGKPTLVKSERKSSSSAREPIGSSCRITDWYTCVAVIDQAIVCKYGYTETYCIPIYDRDGTYLSRTSPSYYLSTHHGGTGGNGDDNSNVIKIPDAVSANVKAGPKPIRESKDKCIGVQAMWASSQANKKERIGFITRDGAFLETQEGTFDNVVVEGLYKFNGFIYYQYEVPAGTPAPTYSGSIQNTAGGVTRNYIPVVATVHTHNPCLVDGTNGVSHPVSADDTKLSYTYFDLRHYVIGCNAIAQYNTTNSSYYNIKTGALNSTCINIK